MTDSSPMSWNILLMSSHSTQPSLSTAPRSLPGSCRPSTRSIQSQHSSCCCVPGVVVVSRAIVCIVCQRWVANLAARNLDVEDLHARHCGAALETALPVVHIAGLLLCERGQCRKLLCARHALLGVVVLASPSRWFSCLLSAGWLFCCRQ